MRYISAAAVLWTATFPCLAGEAGVIDTTRSPHVKQRSVGLSDVRWTRGFWADRFKTVSSVSAPAMWNIMQDPGNSANFANLKIAAGLEKGNFHGNNWSDGDVYKLIETMAAVWIQTRDAKLDQTMDEAIAVIAKAQTPEGYIGTHTQLTTKKRWGNLNYHELYNMGHLITAACVHNRITGKENFLRIATKTADYLYTVFKPRPPELAHFCFNPSQIMALVELYRLTRDPKYLDLAGIFVDMRGSRPGGTDQNQQRVPLRAETQAVGHSVTAAYLWAGATDVYAETGETALWDALQRLWEDVTTRKMYITGGIAAVNKGVSIRNDQIHEAFGLKFQMPNAVAYNETCANIAHAMWSWRMLGVSGDPKYADVVEQVLYNSALSGWGLDGKTYCYTNPLRRHGKEYVLLHNDSWERWPSTTTPGAPYCYCCPPNITRTVAEFGGWAYSRSQDALWVNFYGSNTLRTKLPGGTALHLDQETDYPWDGRIRLTLAEPTQKEVSLFLRVPGWAENASLKVNGKPSGMTLNPQSYAEVKRKWAKGDTVELDLGMRPRLYESHPWVEEARNQVAVMRGPLVYCLESQDLPAGVAIDQVSLPATAKLTSRHDRSLLNGVTVIETEGHLLQGSAWSGSLYRPLTTMSPVPVKLRLIPYYAWNNRGLPHMTVWLPISR